MIGTGPTVRYSAMPEMFESLIYSARHELTITTPYYVPDDPMQAALCASARRGVVTTIVFPARNDSWIVAAASRSYYGDLLDAGVRIFEYQGGLLHTKSLTADMRRRQESYIAKSRPVTLAAVEGWSWQRRLWNNAVALLGPVL